MAQVNYNLPPVDVTGRILSGLQAGRGIRQTFDERAAREQAEQMMSQQQAMQQQYAVDMTDYLSNPTAKGVSALITKHPKQREAFQASWDILNKEQQDSEFKLGTQVYSALQSAQPEEATNILSDRIEAMKNSGQDPSELEAMLKGIERDPKMAMAHIGLTMASVDPEKWDKIITAQEKQAAMPINLKEKQAKANNAAAKEAAELNLTGAQTNKIIAETKLLGLDAKKAVVALEAIKEGKLDPEKTFDQEEKLRKEYTARSKNFNDTQDAFAKIQASAEDSTGAGDIALVTSFMKMLDPGSVVRETEFATARDTAGLVARLGNQAKKLETGQFLDAKQREEFLSLANKYMEATQKAQNNTKKSLEKVVNNYGLNPENVFGAEQAEAPEQAAPPVTTIPAGWSVQVK